MIPLNKLLWKRLQILMEKLQHLKLLGQRVTSIVRESDGTTIKDSDVLKVAAPDFVATGGDTFTKFTVTRN